MMMIELPVAILVRDNILHSYAKLDTDMQAVRISLDKIITLYSVYVPPYSSLSLAQLKKK